VSQRRARLQFALDSIKANLDKNTKALVCTLNEESYSDVEIRRWLNETLNRVTEFQDHRPAEGFGGYKRGEGSLKSFRD
jgi:hypothetical protein